MFEFQYMGWHGFQRLCITICREVFGQTVESFLDSNDAGMDGAFTGNWSQAVDATYSGRFVFQCKFSARPGHRITISELEPDVIKVQALAQAGLCDVYILMTNAGMSGRTRIALEKRLRAVDVSNSLVLQRSWIEEQIRTRRRLRMLVPQMYGLGDLTQILDARAYDQARAVLDSMREELRKVVVTNSYHLAADALDKHRFVLLIGEPASGKTTIASMLAMASADQWGASVIKLHDPAHIVDHWNPQEPSQFFWIDDSFGVTQYESELAKGWNRVLPQVLAALKGGARIVMTSRDYIYNRARSDLKQDAFPLLDESKVVIDVRDISEDEKRQILYNHMKLGRQPAEFKTKIKGLLEGVANHPRFIPEVARRLADPMFTKELDLYQYALAEFVERREQLLVDICSRLDDACKAVLSLIYMRNGRLESPIQLTDIEETALKRMNSDLGRVTQALQSLKDSFVVYVVVEQIACWTYKHPTIRDAFSEILRRNPELLNVFVAGTEVERLAQQVTCGDVGIERAVVLPANLFPQMLDRLSTYQASPSYKTTWLSRWGAKRTLYSFLATRCSKPFLELYLAKFPDIISSVQDPGLYLAWSPEVDLGCRLFELGLLPEGARSKFSAKVCGYALQGADALVLQDGRLRALVTASEMEALRSALLSELLPNLSTARLRRENEYDETDDSHQHMAPFRDAAEALRAEFPDDGNVHEITARELALCEQWELDHAQGDDSLSPRALTIGGQDPRYIGRRDVFEDVDV